MTQYKIEKNVPVAPLPQGREAKYPWDELEPVRKGKDGKMIGDAFTIPNGKASVVSSANKRYKAQGKKFTARRIVEKDAKGKVTAEVLKVWRVQ